MWIWSRSERLWVTPVREKKYELQRKRVRYRLPAATSASSLAAHNLASEGLCEGKRTLLHSGCDNRCFVREGQDKKQGVGGEIIIGKGLAFGACRCWKEDDLLLQCPQWHLATFPEPSIGGWVGGGSAAQQGISVPSMGKAGGCWGGEGGGGELPSALPQSPARTGQHWWDCALPRNSCGGDELQSKYF